MVVTDARRGWYVRFASVLGTLALMAGALGLSSDSAGAKQPTGAPIKIGWLGQIVGGQEDLDGYGAFTAWVDWTNAHGGINGHPIQLFLKREPGDAGMALVDAKQLLGDGIIGLVDADGNDAAWGSVVMASGIPVFVTTNATATFSNTTDAFTTVNGELVSPTEEILAAKKIGANKVAVVYCTEFSACSQAVPYYAAVGKKYGVTVPFSAAVSASAPNYTAQCLGAKQAGANGLFIADTSDTGLRVLQNCAKQGYAPHLVESGGAWAKSFVGAPGTNGMIAAEANVPFFDTKVPGIRTMTDAFNKYEPSLTKSPAYNDEAVFQWTTGLLIAAAANAGKVGTANPVTPGALRNGVYALHSTTLGGMVPTLTFTQGKPEANNCFFYAGIRNNKLTTPYGLTTTCVSQ